MTIKIQDLEQLELLSEEELGEIEGGQLLGQIGDFVQDLVGGTFGEVREILFEVFNRI